MGINLDSIIGVGIVIYMVYQMITDRKNKTKGDNTFEEVLSRFGFLKED